MAVVLLPVVSVMPAADELSPDVDGADAENTEGAEDAEDADGSDSVLVSSGASKHIMYCYNVMYSMQIL